MHQYTQHQLHRYANALALFTIFYNLLEGLVSVGMGINDETLALSVLASIPLSR